MINYDGFVIFDSPEVGESDIMDDIAFAFIYVIKSSNAGGVQSSELGDKWDTLPTQEGNAVMANIINELSLCLPDVDINSQIIRLSTSEALAAEKHGVMNSEFASLTK
ncbi:hypothetical protein pdam_00021723 [Pocillopora damicornis]|uniref:Uncharacterized protein n=1 Tax=Pocillopora damicornis TaxID=46731 RepID=A0A3M6UQI0_POCDA|nr:hypothetical protein pdam_00021723 [Pocillopora damicornis]